MKRNRFKNREEELEAIRQEPAFRALVEELKGQTPRQIDRVNTWLNQRTEKEGDNEIAKEHA